MLTTICMCMLVFVVAITDIKKFQSDMAVKPIQSLQKQKGD